MNKQLWGGYEREEHYIWILVCAVNLSGLILESLSRMVLKIMYVRGEGKALERTIHKEKEGSCMYCKDDIYIFRMARNIMYIYKKMYHYENTVYMFSSVLLYLAVAPSPPPFSLFLHVCVLSLSHALSYSLFRTGTHSFSLLLFRYLSLSLTHAHITHLQTRAIQPHQYSLQYCRALTTVPIQLYIHVYIYTVVICVLPISNLHMY